MMSNSIGFNSKLCLVCCLWSCGLLLVLLLLLWQFRLHFVCHSPHIFQSTSIVLCSVHLHQNQPCDRKCERASQRFTYTICVGKCVREQQKQKEEKRAKEQKQTAHGRRRRRRSTAAKKSDIQFRKYKKEKLISAVSFILTTANNYNKRCMRFTLTHNLFMAVFVIRRLLRHKSICLFSAFSTCTNELW